MSPDAQSQSSATITTEITTDSKGPRAQAQAVPGQTLPGPAREELRAELRSCKPAWPPCKPAYGKRVIFHTPWPPALPNRQTARHITHHTRPRRRHCRHIANDVIEEARMWIRASADTALTSAPGGRVARRPLWYQTRATAIHCTRYHT